MRRRAALVALAALAAPEARAAAPAPPPTPSSPSWALGGLWTAKKSTGEIFRGTWRASVQAATPNEAVGTWALLAVTGETIMEGTWSARKAPRGWRGAWAARVPPGASVIAGTWEADDRALGGGKTFGDMLRRTAERSVAGVWRAGHAHGDWWLQAQP